MAHIEARYSQSDRRKRCLRDQAESGLVVTEYVDPRGSQLVEEQDVVRSSAVWVVRKSLAKVLGDLRTTPPGQQREQQSVTPLSVSSGEQHSV